LKVTRSSNLPEIIIIEPDVFGDDRGRFLETYQAKRYVDYGIPDGFVQDNISYSSKGVLRGLHYQLRQPQGKLVWAVQGEIYDVAIDIRKDSPTFGKWESVMLSSENHKQIYIPEGFAHGFCVISPSAIVEYKCTNYYAPKEERGILWNDPFLNIDWPVDEPAISDKDGKYPFLKDVSVENLPEYEGE
jgi:dTDP-4-dehydrorhamnose 3,5-epimerase